MKPHKKVSEPTLICDEKVKILEVTLANGQVKQVQPVKITPQQERNLARLRKLGIKA